MTHIIKLVLKK